MLSLKKLRTSLVIAGALFCGSSASNAADSYSMFVGGDARFPNGAASISLYNVGVTPTAIYATEWTNRQRRSVRLGAQGGSGCKAGLCVTISRSGDSFTMSFTETTVAKGRGGAIVKYRWDMNVERQGQSCTARLTAAARTYYDTPEFVSATSLFAENCRLTS